MEMFLMDKKTLIIILLSVILVIILGGIGYTLFADHTEYVTETISESETTFDMPNDMTVKSNNSNDGIIVYKNDNTIIVVFNSADKGVAQIMAFANIKNPIFGNEFSGNLTLNNPVISGCSLEGQCNAVFIGNNDTHDNIIVISKNKDIVSHIINSIVWGLKTNTDTNDEPASTDTSSSQPSAYAYKSDGTPMYSQSEVTEYMGNKYGMVEYHIGDNGYIDMDEPGFDDAGNKIDN